MWRQELPDWRLILVVILVMVLVVGATRFYVLPELKARNEQDAPTKGLVRITKRVRTRLDLEETYYADCDNSQLVVKIEWRWDWLNFTVPYRELTDEQFELYCR